MLPPRPGKFRCYGVAGHYISMGITRVLSLDKMQHKLRFGLCLSWKAVSLYAVLIGVDCFLQFSPFPDFCYICYSCTLSTFLVGATGHGRAIRNYWFRLLRKMWKPMQDFGEWLQHNRKGVSYYGYEQGSEAASRFLDIDNIRSDLW